MPWVGQARQELAAEHFVFSAAVSLQQLHPIEAIAPGFNDLGGRRSVKHELLVAHRANDVDGKPDSLEISAELSAHAKVVPPPSERVLHVGLEQLARSGRKRLVGEQIVDLGQRDPAARTKVNRPGGQDGREVHEVGGDEAAPDPIDGLLIVQIKWRSQVGGEELSVGQPACPGSDQQPVIQVYPDDVRTAGHEIGRVIANGAAKVQYRGSNHRRQRLINARPVAPGVLPFVFIGECHRGKSLVSNLGVKHGRVGSVAAGRIALSLDNSVAGNQNKPMPIVTLTSDYGWSDHYVGAMKGAILSIAPGVTLVDITHDVPPYDIAAAGFVLWQAIRGYPSGTVHVAVVDPGVGGSRRGLVGRFAGQVIVAPDNGLLSWVHSDLAADALHSIENEAYFSHNISATFHGRDIFGPVAAHVARGVTLNEFGPAIDDPVLLPFARRAEINASRVVQAEVIYADRFGNLVTNVHWHQLEKGTSAAAWRASVNGSDLGILQRTFADVPLGAALAYVGSTGLIEIGVNQGNAAARFGRDAAVVIAPA